MHKSETEVAQSCLTLCDPMDGSLPGSAIHGIFQVRILEWNYKKLSEWNTRDEISNICWIIEKAREFQKDIYFCFIDYTKAFDYVDHNQPLKILQKMGIPDYLTCLLWNLYSGQEATLRARCETMACFQIWKGVRQVSILSPCLFSIFPGYTMWNAGLDEAQLESRLPGEIPITSDVQMTPPLRQKVKKN